MIFYSVTDFTGTQSVKYYKDIDNALDELWFLYRQAYWNETEEIRMEAMRELNEYHCISLVGIVTEITTSD